MKIDFLADINFLIYLHEGKTIIEPFLKYDFAVSFVSEIELLSHKNLSIEEENCLRNLLNDSFIINVNEEIKQKTIQLRKTYSIKLPDAIIAATAIINEIPLISADKSFAKINELEIIILDY